MLCSAQLGGSVQFLGCVVDGAACQEQRGDLVVTAVSRLLQSRPSPVWVSVGIGASIQQQRGCLQVAKACGSVNRIVATVVYIRPAIEQQCGDRCVASDCCQRKSVSELASTCIQQRLHHSQVTVA